MLRAALVAAFLCGMQHGPAWMKLEQARAASGLSGKPVLLYVAVDPETGDFT